MECGNTGVDKHNRKITKTFINLFNALVYEPPWGGYGKHKR